jgi:hypothetical protein
MVRQLLLEFMSLRLSPLQVDNVTLEPITLGQDLLSPAPTIQRPPAQFFVKRDSRRLGTATRRVLKIVPLMAIAIFEESPVEMIVDALR